MMEKLIERITKLLCVKSIITIMFAAVACYLALKGMFDIKEIVLIIISFYFGTQATKE